MKNEEIIISALPDNMIEEKKILETIVEELAESEDKLIIKKLEDEVKKLKISNKELRKKHDEELKKVLEKSQKEIDNLNKQIDIITEKSKKDILKLEKTLNEIEENKNKKIKSLSVLDKYIVLRSLLREKFCAVGNMGKVEFYYVDGSKFQNFANKYLKAIAQCDYYLKHGDLENLDPEIAEKMKFLDEQNLI